MPQSKKDVELGRFLSLVLRHNPAAAGIQLDAHGWAPVDALLAGCRRAGKPIDRETLERIVRENDKQRYRFNGDHTQIRANQGHSVPVDVELRQQEPPPVLYHGTAARFLPSLREQGITPQSRLYVHLSADLPTALRVGARHGAPAALPIDAQAMARDGHRFYRSENGVWLCKQIPWQYVQQERIRYGR